MPTNPWSITCGQSVQVVLGCDEFYIISKSHLHTLRDLHFDLPSLDRAWCQITWVLGGQVQQCKSFQCLSLSNLSWLQIFVTAKLVPWIFIHSNKVQSSGSLMSSESSQRCSPNHIFSPHFCDTVCVSSKQMMCGKKENLTVKRKCLVSVVFGNTGQTWPSH